MGSDQIEFWAGFEPMPSEPVVVHMSTLNHCCKEAHGGTLTGSIDFAHIIERFQFNSLILVHHNSNCAYNSIVSVITGQGPIVIHLPRLIHFCLENQ